MQSSFPFSCCKYNGKPFVYDTKEAHFGRDDAYLPYHFNAIKQDNKVVLLGQLIKLFCGLPSVLDIIYIFSCG